MSATQYNNAQPWRVKDLPALFVDTLPKGAATKKRDPAFVEAVRQFQLSHELTPDGMLGPQTLEAMRAFFVGPPKPKEVGLRIDGSVYDPGFRVVQGAPFKSRNRAVQPCQIMLHESVTADPNILEEDDTTERVLRRRGLGVHLMIGPDGTLVQHNDLVLDMPAHAGRQNRYSIGIEVVGPYYNAKAPWWNHVIKARWAHKGRYAVPPLAQMIALGQLVDCLCGYTFKPKHGLDLSHEPVVGYLVSDDPRTKPGIWAHATASNHADGLFPRWFIEELWALNKKGKGKSSKLDHFDSAYEKTIERAKS